MTDHTVASAQASSNGIGALSLLGVLFVALKLTGFIDWSWWWVTAPFWVPVVSVILALSSIVLIAVIETANERKLAKRRRFK